jgi:uncharacterized protein YprB with RNaseH-like and TPR domain/predicted RNA-binding Zn-ribbon protein involved in translation (DUF1610 family)
MAKILIWDIETADLNADLGHILCIAYKWYGEDIVHVCSRTEELYWPAPGFTLWDDRQVIKNFIPIIQQADDQVTWYGKRFDEPYIRARMAYWGMKNDFPPIHHTDLWETSRKEFKLSNNRLATVGKFLQLEEGKMHMPVQDWKRASHGDMSTMLKVEKRCASDVWLLEEAYTKMRPFIRVNRFNHSVLAGHNYNCPTCGSRKVQRRGTRMTLTAKWLRWQCQDCGAWSSSPAGGTREHVLR